MHLSARLTALLSTALAAWTSRTVSAHTGPGSHSDVAENHTVINAPRKRVFEVLADPESYGDWIVGSKEIRAADSSWPAPGSRFHHTVGLVGPLTVQDYTCVEEADPPRRLVLRAKTRPLATARVTLRLEPGGRRSTRVTMEEVPIGGPPACLYGTLVNLLLGGRNEESLRRLKSLAEGRP